MSGIRICSCRARPEPLAVRTVWLSDLQRKQEHFHEKDEYSAAVELRRLFPGIRDTEQARERARTIAGWRLPKQRPALALRRRGAAGPQ